MQAMFKRLPITSILIGATLICASVSAQGAGPMTLYKCNAQVMGAAQAIISRRKGAAIGAVEETVMGSTSSSFQAAAKRGVAAIYSIDEEMFANSLGMGMLDDVKKHCMGQ